MNIEKVLELQEVISDKRLPIDMHSLNDYYYFSQSKRKWLSLSKDIDLIHFIRLAIKNLPQDVLMCKSDIVAMYEKNKDIIDRGVLSNIEDIANETNSYHRD